MIMATLNMLASYGSLVATACACHIRGLPLKPYLICAHAWLKLHMGRRLVMLVSLESLSLNSAELQKRWPDGHLDVVAASIEAVIDACLCHHLCMVGQDVKELPECMPESSSGVCCWGMMGMLKVCVPHKPSWTGDVLTHIEGIVGGQARSNS